MNGIIVSPHWLSSSSPAPKGFKYSLKAEYSYIVTSDWSRIPVGFRRTCTEGHQKEMWPRRVQIYKYISTFYQGAETCVYWPYQNFWTCSCLESLPAAAKALPHFYLEIQGTDIKSLVYFEAVAGVRYSRVEQCLCPLQHLFFSSVPPPCLVAVCESGNNVPLRNDHYYRLLCSWSSGQLFGRSLPKMVMNSAIYPCVSCLCGVASYARVGKQVALLKKLKGKIVCYQV